MISRDLHGNSGNAIGIQQFMKRVVPDDHTGRCEVRGRGPDVNCGIAVQSLVPGVQAPEILIRETQSSAHVKPCL